MERKIELGTASCPSCQQTVGSEPGQPVTPHQKADDSREQCPGGIGQ